MNEVIMIRCGQTWDGESLYRVYVDGKELTAILTLRETVDALRMVEEVKERRRCYQSLEQEGRGVNREVKPARWCKTFHCNARGDRYCCADCWMRTDCPDPCLNHPSRCGLENTAKRGERK